MFIFLDETGQFVKKDHEKYFVLGSFTVGDPRRTEKRFRSFIKNSYPKHLRHLSEIKFSNNSISDELRLRTLRFLSNLDVRAKFAYLKRENIPVSFRTNNHQIKAGELYTHAVGDLLEMYLPANEQEFRVFCDKRQLKGLTTADFKRILIARLLPKLPPNPNIQIEMVDSTSSANIQITDWLTGAIGRRLEKKRLGEECSELIKNNITGIQELFVGREERALW